MTGVQGGQVHRRLAVYPHEQDFGFRDSCRAVLLAQGGDLQDEDG